MQLTPVQSSNIAAIGYDPALGELTVQFHDGAPHTHSGVPPETHAALVGAPSIGQFYAAHVKGAHPGRRA